MQANLPSAGSHPRAGDPASASGLTSLTQTDSDTQQAAGGSPETQLFQSTHSLLPPPTLGILSHSSPSAPVSSPILLLILPMLFPSRCGTPCPSRFPLTSVTATAPHCTPAGLGPVPGPCPRRASAVCPKCTPAQACLLLPSLRQHRGWSHEAPALHGGVNLHPAMLLGCCSLLAPWLWALVPRISSLSSVPQEPVFSPHPLCISAPRRTAPICLPSSRTVQLLQVTDWVPFTWVSTVALGLAHTTHSFVELKSNACKMLTTAED